MKLKYIFASLTAAVAGIFLTTSCEKETEQHLSEIQVSSSYISLPAEGGKATFKIKAEAEWAFDAIFTVKTGEKDENEKDITIQVVTPEWLTISPVSGPAGETVVTLEALEAADTRSTSLSVTCLGKTQIINVIQMTEKKEMPITPIAEAIATGAGSFRLKGMVTKVANTQYGNFYIKDDTGEIYIYGVKNAQGQYPKDAAGGWDSFGLAEGDVVTLEGPYKLYGETPEIVDAAIVAIEKSLIDVAAFDFDKLPAEGATFEMTVSAKVSPLLVSTDSEWLAVTGVSDSGAYILTAAANDYTAERTATIKIEGPGALKTVSVTQVGIPATGVSVTEIVALEDNSEIETLECTVVAKTTKGVIIWDGETACYVYGTKVDEVKIGDNIKVIGKKTSYNGVPEIVFTEGSETHLVKVYSSGNSFEVPAADDVTPKAKDYTASKAEYIKLTGTLKVSGNYLNLELDAFADGSKQGSIVAPTEDLNAKSFDGKKITVTGWFNGLSSAGKYINVIATKIVEYADNPKGTESNPYLASEIAAEILAGNTPAEDVYIKGIVSAVLYDASANYPTATFWISDDGTANGISADKKTTTVPAKDFECYGVKWFGNTDWAEGNGQVRVGDEVIVCGKTTSYNGVAETSNKKAWLHSVNYVKTAGVGLGNAEFPFNVAGAEAVIDFQQAEIAAAKAAELPTPIFVDVCVGGKISAILYDPSASYPTCTFWISDDGTAHGVSADKKTTTAPDKDFECYSVKWFGNTDWTEGSAKPAVGDDVIVKGQLTIYNGTYETASKKAWIYSLNGATE